MRSSIRKYKETDLGAVLSVWESANKLAHPFLPEDYVAKVRLDIPSLYLPNADTWVSVHDGAVVGFIALIGHEVGAIFIDTQFQNMGLGKALMDKARSLHKTIELDVFKQNSIGRKFYASYGFELMAETNHEETGFPVLRLIYSS